MERRQFIRNTAIGAAGLGAGQAGKTFKDIFISKHKPETAMFIGTPVLPEYLYEKGIPETLGFNEGTGGS